MRKYRSGWELEEAIFGRHSSGLPVRYQRRNGDHTKRRWNNADFNADIRLLINKSKVACPDSNIGRSLYSAVWKELERAEIDPTGLVFLDALDTKVDWLHYSDGVFYLPQIDRHGLVVTFDAFNIDPSEVEGLRELWIDSFSGNLYSQTNLQDDLFCYKKGLMEWKKKGSNHPNGDFFRKVDFRTEIKKGRPENHFILTPYHLGSRGRRRMFGKLVADYFQKAIQEKTEKTALQSP